MLFNFRILKWDWIKKFTLIKNGLAYIIFPKIKRWKIWWISQSFGKHEILIELGSLFIFILQKHENEISNKSSETKKL